MRRFIICTCLLLVVNHAAAQLGSWNILTMRADLAKKWSVSAEGQIRSLRFYDDFHYFEYKAGLYYDISEKFTIGALVGHYRTYSQGATFLEPVLSDELRTCFQISLKQKVKLLKFEHRYRIEQRFTSNGFRNRFRYRFSVNIPLGDQKKDKYIWALNLSNELFLTNVAPYFERVRFFGGISLKFTDHLSMQAGFLHQFDYNLIDEIGRDFFQIGFQYEFNAANVDEWKDINVPHGND